MLPTKPTTFLVGATMALLIALAGAACGGGKAATAATSGASATVDVANRSLGSILVDSQGRTLYLFKADSGTKSSCTAACASAWPPLLTTGHPTAGSGVAGGKLGTTARSGGGKQVTYNRHPLYLYAGDKEPGDVSGQGIDAFGAPWYVLSAAGNQITGHASSAGGASTAVGSGASGDPVETSAGTGFLSRLG